MSARWIARLSWIAILGGAFMTIGVMMCGGPGCFWHNAHHHKTVVLTGLGALVLGTSCFFFGRHIQKAKRETEQRRQQLENERRMTGAADLSDVEREEEIRAVKSRADSLDHWQESIFAVLVVILCCLLLVSLVTLSPNVFESPTFDKAHVEWFLMIGWGVSIVGAIWAVLAKRKADMAFEQARFAAQKSEAAYYAVTTKALSFYELTIGGRLKEHISKAKDELILLLGSPFVGYFGEGETTDGVAQNVEEVERKDGANDGAAKYIQAAKLIAFAVQAQFAITEKARVVFFNWDLCAGLAEKANTNKVELRGLYDGFSSAVSSQAMSSGGSLPTKFAVSYKMLGVASPAGPLPANEDRKPDETNAEVFDPGIRIAISKNDDYRHAYVWFVEGFVDKEPSKFSSVAFETKDPTLIRLLESLVEEYAKKLGVMLAARGNSTIQPPSPSDPS